MTTVRPHIARGLLGNSIALLAMTNITALLGYVFWTICARCFSASVVGLTNTVISAMTLVAIADCRRVHPDAYSAAAGS